VPGVLACYTIGFNPQLSMATSGTSTAVTLNGKTLLIPGPRYDAAIARAGLPPGFANRYWCPVGPEPGKATVLIQQADWNDIQQATTYALTFAQTKEGGRNTTVPIRKLRVSRPPVRLFLGGEGDKFAAYAVELADVRQVMRMSVANAQYNVRQPAPHTNTYNDVLNFYTGSLNGGGLWTWQAMLSDLWDVIPGGIYAAPTLPYSPTSQPEGWRLVGVNAWDALHVVLRKLGCTTAYDPIADTFSCIRLGSPQALPEKLGLPVFDAEPFDKNHHAPETGRVFFFKWYRSYGTEHDTLRDPQWSVTPITSQDVATGIDGAPEGSVVALWDDMPYVLDKNNDPENTSDLSARAAQIVANYALDFTTPRVRKVYGELLDSIKPGSQVRAVQWSYREDQGTLTQYVSHPGLPVSPIGGMGDTSWAEPSGPSPAMEAISPPDFSRHTFANYPRLENIVEVYSDASTTGCILPQSGYFPGRIKRLVADAVETEETVWLYAFPEKGCETTDSYTGSGSFTALPAVAHLRAGSHYVGRLCGVATVSGVTHPVYLITVADELADLVIFQLTADRAYANDTTAAKIVRWDGAAYSAVSPAIPITVVGPVAKWVGKIGYRGWAKKAKDRVPASMSDPPIYEIVVMEGPARWIVANLTSDASLVGGDHYEATIDPGAGTTIQWGWALNGKPQPGSSLTIYDYLNVLKNAKSGYVVRALYDERQDIYYADVVETLYSFVRFTLTSALAGSGTATLDDGYSINTWDVKSPGSLTVSDPAGIFSRALSGAKGYARYDWNDDAYYVINCQTKAGWIYFTLTSALSSSSAPSTTLRYGGNEGTDIQDPGNVTVYDDDGIFTGATSGAKGIATYDWANDKYRIVGMASDAKPKWYRASANWHHNTSGGGFVPYVLCKLVTAAPGYNSSTTTGSDVRVYLPRTGYDGDPNVISGQNILAALDDFGDLICVSDYMDEKVGTVKPNLWSTARQGWGVMDGSANSSMNGGSGFDASSRFLRSRPGYGSPVGATDADYGGDSDDASSPNPFAHNHKWASDGLQGYKGSGATPVSGDPATEFWAFNSVDSFGSDGDSEAGEGVDLYTADAEPYFLAVVLMERLDNSSG
jgi:hypothetical protein